MLHGLHHYISGLLYSIHERISWYLTLTLDLSCPLQWVLESGQALCHEQESAPEWDGLVHDHKETLEECQTEGHQTLVQEMQNEDYHLQEVQTEAQMSQDDRQTVVLQLKESHKALALVHCMVAHYWEVEGSPHFQQTEVGQVLVWMSLRVRERLYIEVSLILEEAQSKEVHQLENRPPPAGLGRVMAPGSPPAAQRNFVLS